MEVLYRPTALAAVERYDRFRARRGYEPIGDALWNRAGLFRRVPRRAIALMHNSSMGLGEQQDTAQGCVRLRDIVTAYGAWLATDVEGIGVRIVWMYSGSLQHVNWHEAWGPEGGIEDVGGSSILQPGMRGGRTSGGLLLPSGAKAGDRVWFGDRITTGVYGVKVEYTLRAGPQGMEVSNQTVAPWN